mmetsp:Transcript_41180/g.36497  ORF Transcript_41180/g.36497 Transcript_41180/m.36497 type:complete len:261 (+) Transcript_41180:1177-1959(+)
MMLLNELLYSNQKFQSIHQHSLQLGSLSLILQSGIRIRSHQNVFIPEQRRFVGESCLCMLGLQELNGCELILKVDLYIGDGSKLLELLIQSIKIVVIVWDVLDIDCVVLFGAIMRHISRSDRLGVVVSIFFSNMNLMSFGFFIVKGFLGSSLLSSVVFRSIVVVVIAIIRLGMMLLGGLIRILLLGRRLLLLLIEGIILRLFRFRFSLWWLYYWHMSWLMLMLMLIIWVKLLRISWWSISWLRLRVILSILLIPHLGMHV